MTKTTSSMVMDVSAMLVAMTTFRTPRGLEKVRRCSSDDSVECRGMSKNRRSTSSRVPSRRSCKPANLRHARQENQDGALLVLVRDERHEKLDELEVDLLLVHRLQTLERGIRVPGVHRARLVRHVPAILRALQRLERRRARRRAASTAPRERPEHATASPARERVPRRAFHALRLLAIASRGLDGVLEAVLRDGKTCAPGLHAPHDPGTTFSKYDWNSSALTVADMATSLKSSLRAANRRRITSKKSESKSRSCTSSTTTCVTPTNPGRSATVEARMPVVQNSKRVSRLCRDSRRMLYPTTSPTRSHRSAATRSATAIALSRRGCVMIDGTLPLARRESPPRTRTGAPAWFPAPVAPLTTDARPPSMQRNTAPRAWRTRVTPSVSCISRHLESVVYGARPRRDARTSPRRARRAFGGGVRLGAESARSEDPRARERRGAAAAATSSFSEAPRRRRPPTRAAASRCRVPRLLLSHALDVFGEPRELFVEVGLPRRPGASLGALGVQSFARSPRDALGGQRRRLLRPPAAAPETASLSAAAFSAARSSSFVTAVLGARRRVARRTFPSKSNRRHFRRLHARGVTRLPIDEVSRRVLRHDQGHLGAIQSERASFAAERTSTSSSSASSSFSRFPRVLVVLDLVVLDLVVLDLVSSTPRSVRSASTSPPPACREGTAMRFSLLRLSLPPLLGFACLPWRTFVQIWSVPRVAPRARSASASASRLASSSAAAAAARGAASCPSRRVPPEPRGGVPATTPRARTPRPRPSETPPARGELRDDGSANRRRGGWLAQRQERRLGGTDTRGKWISDDTPTTVVVRRDANRPHAPSRVEDEASPSSATSFATSFATLVAREVSNASSKIA